MRIQITTDCRLLVVAPIYSGFETRRFLWRDIYVDIKCELSRTNVICDKQIRTDDAIKIIGKVVKEKVGWVRRHVDGEVESAIGAKYEAKRAEMIFTK